MSLEEALKEADIADAEGKLSYQAVAKKYNVCRTTLSRHQRVVASRANADQQLLKLHPTQEQELCEFIVELTKRGLPPTRQIVQNMASELAADRVSDSWVTRFLDRHRDQLLYKWANAIDAQRLHADSSENYIQYFKLVHSKMTGYSIEPQHTYNMDEKGFAIGVLNRRTKRVFSRASVESKTRRQPLQDGNRQWVSILASVCADGSALPPGIIYPGAPNEIQSTWVEDIEPVKHSVFVTATPSGWKNDEVGLAWLEQVFDRYTREKARRSWRLLIVDGHGSHITWSFIKYCDRNRILLLVFLPRSTHTLQPLDVALFSPLAQAIQTSSLNTFTRLKA